MTIRSFADTLIAITPKTHDVLDALSPDAGVTSAELAASMGVSRYAIGRRLGQLAKKGLAEKWDGTWIKSMDAQIFWIWRESVEKGESE